MFDRRKELYESLRRASRSEYGILVLHEHSDTETHTPLWFDVQVAEAAYHFVKFHDEWVIFLRDHFRPLDSQGEFTLGKHTIPSVLPSVEWGSKYHANSWDTLHTEGVDEDTDNEKDDEPVCFPSTCIFLHTLT